MPPGPITTAILETFCEFFSATSPYLSFTSLPFAGFLLPSRLGPQTPRRCSISSLQALLLGWHWILSAFLKLRHLLSLHTPNSKNAFPRMSKPPLFKLLHREFTRPPITSHNHQTRRTKEGCSLPNPRIQTGPSSRHQSSTKTLRLPS